jgi:O-antigen ligase
MKIKETDRTRGIDWQLPCGLWAIAVVGCCLGIGVLTGQGNTILLILLCVGAIVPFLLMSSPALFAYLLVIAAPLYGYPLATLSSLVPGADSTSVALGHPIGILLIFASLLHYRSKCRPWRANAVSVGAVLVLLAYLMSSVGVLLWSQGWSQYFQTLLNVCFFLSIFLSLKLVIKTHELFYSLLRSWVWVAFLISLYGIYQFLAFFLPALPVIPGTAIIQYGGIARAYSIVLEPSQFGNLMLFPFVVTMVAVLHGAEFPPTVRKWNLAIGGVILTACLLTFSLSVYFNILLFVGLYPLAMRLTRRKASEGLPGFLPLVVVSCVFIMAVWVSGVAQPIVDRIISVSILSDASTQLRVNRIQIGLMAFQESPVFGLGAGNLRFYNTSFQWNPDAFGTARTAESILITILAETGLIGVCAFLFLIGTMVRALVRRSRVEGGLGLAISRGFLMGLMVYALGTIVAWLQFWVWTNLGFIAVWIALPLPEIVNPTSEVVSD